MHRFVSRLIQVASASVILNSAAHAQTPAFSGVTGAFYAVAVPDLAAARKWYAEKFGMAVKMEQVNPAAVSVCVLEGGGLTIELLQHHNAPASQAQPNPTGGITKAGFVIDNLTQTLSVLRSRGVVIAYGPYPASGSQRANAIVRDLNGNLIQLFGR